MEETAVVTYEAQADEQIAKEDAQKIVEAIKERKNGIKQDKKRIKELEKEIEAKKEEISKLNSGDTSVIKEYTNVCFGWNCTGTTVTYNCK